MRVGTQLELLGADLPDSTSQSNGVRDDVVSITCPQHGDAEHRGAQRGGLSGHNRLHIRLETKADVKEEGEEDGC